MKPLFDRVFSKAKTLFDAYKMWIFFAALLSTNGIQAGWHMNNDDEVHVKKPVINVKPVTGKTIIIRKVDNKFCIDLMNEHSTGAQH